MNLACQWQPGIAITINHQESQCPQDQLKQTAGKSKLYPESSMPPTYMDITWLLIPLTALLLLVPSQDIPHTLSAVTPYSLRIYTTMLWGLNFMCTSDEFFIISDKFALLTQESDLTACCTDDRSSHHMSYHYQTLIGLLFHLWAL